MIFVVTDNLPLVSLLPKTHRYTQLELHFINTDCWWWISVHFFPLLSGMFHGLRSLHEVPQLGGEASTSVSLAASFPWDGTRHRVMHNNS